MNRYDEPNDPESAPDTQVDVPSVRQIRRRARRESPSEEQDAAEPFAAARPERVQDVMTAATTRVVHMREAMLRRSRPHAATEGTVGDRPRTPDERDRPALVSVVWVRPPSGLRARRVAIDVIALSGVARVSGWLELLLDDQQWRVAVNVDDHAMRVARRLKRRLGAAYEVEVCSRGEDGVVVFKGPRTPFSER